jgi:alanine-glyoxylate transaminase/serine-glyoxylate transaminase/serine-pyruvate transaminase
MGVDVEVLKGGMRRAVRPAEVEARLKADKDGTIKAVLVAQIDTASGVVNDIAAIGQAIRAAGHDAPDGRCGRLARLHALRDGPLGVDVAMSGSQKGMMTPPGLGFVVANDRAREVHKTAGLRTSGTGPTARAISTTRSTPARRPSICCSACARLSTCSSRTSTTYSPPQAAGGSGAPRRRRWSEGQAIGFNHQAVRTQRCDHGGPAERQPRPGSPARLLQSEMRRDPRPRHRRPSGKAIRIAHMGHVNAPMMLGTLSVIEVGLNALGILHGKGGAQAAIDWLGEQVKA